MSQEQQHLSGPMVILCVVNGMIGGLILILPVMALQAGWLLTLIVLLVTGFVSYYSCFLCILHTGKEKDLDVAILKHFNGSRKMKVLYELCILINLLLLAMLYYQLIVLQWIGLTPPHQFTKTNAFLNFLVLFIMVLVIKFKEFGASLMAYGIVSIIAYLLFVTWVVGSQDASHDHSSLKLAGGSGIDLAAALGQAFAIQCFFIPILKKNKKQHKHKMYLIFIFILGSLAYAYIAFMGSYGIVHRKFQAEGEAKTIQGYFDTGTWQVAALEIIYLVHLYSVLPQYLLISKHRFFSIFGIQESEVGRINKKQFIYVVSVLGICLIIVLAQVNLRYLIEINGAVIGFFFIYFFPIAIHVKCCYMQPQKLLQEQKEVQQIEKHKYVEMMEEKDNKDRIDKPEQKNEQECVDSDDKYYDIVKKESEKASEEGFKGTIITVPSQSQKKISQPCQGTTRSVSKRQKIAEISLFVFMIILGLVILIQGVVEMLKGDIEQ